MGGIFRVGIGGAVSEFFFDANNDIEPNAGVLVDSKRGALYGTTSGGLNNGGTVFAIVPPAQKTTLYDFCSQPNCLDGDVPLASVVEDQAGNLYGTTKRGGTNDLGIVYEVVQSLPTEATQNERQH